MTVSFSTNDWPTFPACFLYFLKLFPHPLTFCFPVFSPFPCSSFLLHCVSIFSLSCCPFHLFLPRSTVRSYSSFLTSFLFPLSSIFPCLPASSSSPNPCNRIARFGNHQARMNVATSPPTAAPARFAPRPLAFTFYLRLFLLYSPVFHSRSSARFFVRSFLLFSHAFQFPYLYCLIFHAFFSLWAWSSVDLAHAILKHFSTTLPCNFFTKHSTSVDASFLCAIVFLRVACSWGWTTSFPVPSSFRLFPSPFCHLSFFLTFVFVSPLFPFHPTFLFSSPLPLPWWFFDFPPFSCRSFFPAYRFIFFLLSSFTSLISHISSTFMFSPISDISGFFLKTPEPRFPFATSPASSCSLLPFFFSTPLLLFCCSPLYETLQFSRQVIFCRLFV